MRDICLNGPGHYLGHNQTLSLMQTEYIYPVLGDRTSPKEWAENGKPDLLLKAKERTKDLLSTPTKEELNPSLRKEIMQKFPIHLKI